MDGYPTARECGESKENWRGRHWGVLRAGWNGVARARGHNTQDKGSRNGKTTGGRVTKVSVTGGGVRLASLNIRSVRVGGNGYGTPGAPAGERGCGIPTGDEVDAGHSHRSWSGVKGLGNGGGELALGGVGGGLERGKGMAGGEYVYLCP